MQKCDKTKTTNKQKTTQKLAGLRWFHLNPAKRQSTEQHNTHQLLYVRYIYIFFFSTGATTHCGLYFAALYRATASSRTRFLDHTQRRVTVGRTPLDEWSVRRRDLYLTTHNTHNRQTSMPPVGFEPTISKGERPKTYALDRAVTGTGGHTKCLLYKPIP